MNRVQDKPRLLIVHVEKLILPTQKFLYQSQEDMAFDLMCSLIFDNCSGIFSFGAFEVGVNRVCIA